jgi:hypothetical protein
VNLRNYVVNLYDTNKNLINNSPILTSLPMQYLFSNLQTETNYYIEFVATSSEGLTGTSGLISFSVFYYRPKQTVYLTGKNIDNAGIELTWFVRQIILENVGGTFINNDEIDVTNGTVTADTGFSIDRDFSLKVWLRGVENNVPLITLYGDNGQIVLKYNALRQAFILSKTTTFTSNYLGIDVTDTRTADYVFVSPYQLIDSNGDKAVVLIQQIGMDMNLEVTYI